MANFSSFLFCEQCDRPTRSPIWLRYDQAEYHAHCPTCAAERDRQLTAENAICHALIIIGLWQGQQRPLQIGGVE